MTVINKKSLPKALHAWLEKTEAMQDSLASKGAQAMLTKYGDETAPQMNKLSGKFSARAGLRAR